MRSGQPILNGGDQLPKFIVDGMLGKLCRWLRLLGFDSSYAGCEISDSEIIEISLLQNRIILTSDRELSSRSGNALFINSRDLKVQIKYVLSQYAPSPGLFMGRCSICNGELESVNLKQVNEKVPDSVYERKIPVKHCRYCGKYYWEGSHYFSIINKLRELSGEIV